MKKLFVGNLPYSTTEDELRNLFAEHGDVSSVIIINDRETGRSRGFGFVEFSTEEEADAAAENLHERDLKGRKLIVNKARPRK